MIVRLVLLIAALAAIALLALAIRQQRLATARVISAYHNDVDHLRQETRTLMTPISAKTTPEEIHAGCKRAKLVLEPVDAPGQAPVEPPPDKNDAKKDARKNAEEGGRR